MIQTAPNTGPAGPLPTTPSAGRVPPPDRPALPPCGEAPRTGAGGFDPRRAELAPHVLQLAAVVSASWEPHGETLRAFALALRGAGWSAGRIAKRWRVTARAVREWCEPGAAATPTKRDTVRRVQEHAAELVGKNGSVLTRATIPHPFGSMAHLLELKVRAEEARRRDEGSTAWVAGPCDVADAAEACWPSVRGALAGSARSSFLVTVRGAVSAVLAARGWPQDVIGETVGRSRSTVAYHLGAAAGAGGAR